jgi:hypothetical protein
MEVLVERVGFHLMVQLEVVVLEEGVRTLVLEETVEKVGTEVSICMEVTEEGEVTQVQTEVTEEGEAMLQTEKMMVSTVEMVEMVEMAF